jgi:hypothetical protein
MRAGAPLQAIANEKKEALPTQRVGKTLQQAVVRRMS